jgi:hypothetical protein
MTLVLNPSDPHGPEQVLRFTEHVQTLKQIALIEAGRDEAVTKFTVDSPIPYRLDSLIQMLANDNTEKIPQHPSNRMDPGPFFGQMTGLINRIAAGGRTRVTASSSRHRIRRSATAGSRTPRRCCCSPGAVNRDDHRSVRGAPDRA